MCRKKTSWRNAFLHFPRGFRLPYSVSGSSAVLLSFISSSSSSRLKRKRLICSRKFLAWSFSSELEAELSSAVALFVCTTLEI